MPPKKLLLRLLRSAPLSRFDVVVVVVDDDVDALRESV
jgi:hypothetical protein